MVIPQVMTLLTPSDGKPSAARSPNYILQPRNERWDTHDKLWIRTIGNTAVLVLVLNPDPCRVEALSGIPLPRRTKQRIFTPDRSSFCNTS